MKNNNSRCLTITGAVCLSVCEEKENSVCVQRLVILNLQLNIALVRAYRSEQIRTTLLILSMSHCRHTVVIYRLVYADVCYEVSCYIPEGAQYLETEEVQGYSGT